MWHEGVSSGQQKEQYADKLRIPLTKKQKNNPLVDDANGVEQGPVDGMGTRSCFFL